MKRQTLVLVAIAVVLFVAGGAIAFASVISGNKNKSATNTVTASTTPVVVALTNIPAGTPGQQLIAQNMIGIQAIPAKHYQATDLTNIGSLTNVVTTTALSKGTAVQSSDISASATSTPIPAHMNLATITMSGTQALAGYLQPGSQVDVYAYVTKLSSPASGQTQSNVPLPCTELAMTDITVQDVQSTVPSYSSHPSASGRSVPGTETVLLVVTPDQAREIEFLSQIATLSVVQTQKGTLPPTLGQCIGTPQTVGS